MAKKSNPTKVKMGRPRKEVPLDERVLVRMDATQKAALQEYAKDIGAGGESGALRQIMIEKLKAVGKLK